MLTEDIDISWKLQCRDWRVVYEPHALSWILMPETVKGLYRQRLRWSKGGIQVLMKYAGTLARPTQMMMWPLFAEYLIGIAWAYSMTFIPAARAHQCRVPAAARLARIGRAALARHAAGRHLHPATDHRQHDRSSLRRKLLMYFLDTIWYPVAFWLISMITTVVALPAIVLRAEASGPYGSAPTEAFNMKNAPIIDLSLRAPRELIAERGRIIGSVLTIWFRLLRPALVGPWASICIYTYRYLLPFNPAEMPIEQMVFYATSIALIAGTIVMWLIAGRACIRWPTGCACRRYCDARPARRCARCRRPCWQAPAGARGARRAFRRVARRERLDFRHRMGSPRGAAAPRVGQRRCAAAHGDAIRATRRHSRYRAAALAGSPATFVDEVKHVRNRRSKRPEQSSAATGQCAEQARVSRLRFVRHRRTG